MSVPMMVARPMLHDQRGLLAWGGPFLSAGNEPWTSSGRDIVQQMKAIPTDDPLFGKGSVRADGRVLHPMYLFQVKSPSESRYAWD
jgi:hypothetical protein